ncbi:hypothetical protein AN219_37490 [Streptomyces nanshensis]|nr:hypothetical protein AN219_37490 [Streptomyces nanshensis]
MTVGDLIDLLADFERNATPRLAINPLFPMSHPIRAVVPGTDEEGRPTVFLADGEPQSHLPPQVARQLTWHPPIEAPRPDRRRSVHPAEPGQ